jgi:GDP-L-fucose synthase
MARIFVAGHRGLVGSALVRALQADDRPWEILTRTRAELDLLDGTAVRAFFEAARPECVILAAAKVGGIKANSDFPVEFLLDNLKIQNNVLESAYASGVKKLLFLGSSCIYPKLAPQPIHEEALLTGPLELTNRAYAIAKIAGIELCQAYRRQYGADFISAMPTNLYGPNDNFDLQTSHVLPALIHKFHLAKIQEKPSVLLWGSGSPRRELLHADDLAAACLLLLDQYSSPEIINIGTGEDVTILELAGLVRDIVGFQGEIAWDASKPDGTPQKLLDINRIRALGWSPRIGLQEGIASAYRWFLENELLLH